MGKENPMEKIKTSKELEKLRQSILAGQKPDAAGGHASAGDRDASPTAASRWRRRLARR